MAESFKINKSIVADILIVLGLIGALYNVFSIHQEAKINVLEKYETINSKNELMLNNFSFETPKINLETNKIQTQTEPTVIYPDNEYLVAFKLINVMFYLFFVSLIYGKRNKIIKE